MNTRTNSKKSTVTTDKRSNDAPKEVAELVTPPEETIINAQHESAPEADDDLLFATDADGNRISDEEQGAHMKRVHPLKFSVGNMRHVVEVRLVNVPYSLTKRLKNTVMLLAIQAGYKFGEEINPVKAEEQGDERFNNLVELSNQSPEVREIHAEIAAAAPVRDTAGRVRTSVAEFREELTAQTLLNAGVAGDAFIDTVATWYQSNRD